MKKRLCLFIMSLLLFMTAGCSQVTSQTPGASAMEASGNVSGSIAAVNPDSDTVKDGSSSDELYTGRIDDNSVIPGSSSDKNPFPDAMGTDLTNSSSGTDSLPVADPVYGDSDPEADTSPTLQEDGSYTSKEDVALYIHLYGHLPPNFITKKEAEKLGWKGGSLEPYAPGMCIGGSYFGNYEELLPVKEGRSYTECDIDTLGADKRGSKRIVFSNDGLIYYTEDHYASFELLYGETDP